MRVRVLLGVSAGLSLLVLGIVHVLITAHQIERPPHADEAEHLHVSWLMSRGQHMYRDFFEDHSPLLDAGLRPLVPTRTTAAFPRLDVPRFLRSARWLMAVLGVLAAGCVALLAWRTTRRASGPVVAIGLLFGSYWTWRLGLADVRNDPPALFLFWLGVLLLLWRFEHSTAAALRAGLGAGLVAASFLENPKWPIATLAVGVVYFIDVVRLRRRALVALLAGAAPIALAVATIASMASLRDFWSFTFTLNLRIFAWYKHSKFIRSFFHVPFEYASEPFRRALPLLAMVTLLAALIWPRARERFSGLDRRSSIVVLVLAGASFLDVRLTPSYPNLLAQYYMMWSFAAALVYGCLPGAVVALARAVSERTVRFSPALDLAVMAVTLWLFVHESAWRLVTPNTRPFWVGMSMVQRSLRPGETVWTDSRAHPIGADDATYYWYAFADNLPAAIGGRLPWLPAARDADLPLCRAWRGEDKSLRFVSNEQTFTELPASRDCFRKLWQAGRLSGTQLPGVFELVR